MRGPTSRPRALLAWRCWITAVSLLLAIFAWHDAFWIAPPYRLHFEPLLTGAYGMPDRLWALVRLCMLAFALLTAWRSRGNRPARLLTWGLIGASTNIYWQWYGYWGFPGQPDSRFWILFPLVLNYAGVAYGTMQLLRFAASFGSGDVRGIRAAVARHAGWVFWALVAFGLVPQILKLSPDITLIPGWDDTYLSRSDTRAVHAVYLLADAAAKLLMIAAAVIGWRCAQPAERRRMLLVVVAFSAYALGTAVHFVGYALLGDSLFLHGVDAMLTLMLPVGLVSAARSNLFLDVELFVDPAVAFGLSIVAVAVVVYLLDVGGNKAVDILSQVIGFIFRGSSINPNLVAAFTGLTAGALFIVAINHFHDRIVHHVRNRIFPGRAERLEKLEDALADVVVSHSLERFTATMRTALYEYAKARYAQIYVRDGRGEFLPLLAGVVGSAPVSEREPEVQTMATTGQWVQLDDVPSRIPGVLAFPMTVSGTMVGFVVCGPSIVQARYGEDEIKKLAALARVAGAALVVLQRHGCV